LPPVAYLVRSAVLEVGVVICRLFYVRAVEPNAESVVLEVDSGYGPLELDRFRHHGLCLEAFGVLA
jgi:hypothetical protein